MSQSWDTGGTLILMAAPLFTDRVQTGEFPPAHIEFALEVVATDPVSTLTLTDYDVDGAPLPDDLGRLSAPLSATLSEELDGASRHLGVPAQEILLAALGRAVHRTIGSGVAAVDVVADAGAVLHGVALNCVGPDQVDATGMLAGVHASIADPAGPCAAEVTFSYAESSPAVEIIPGQGHALELRAHHNAGVLALDWWYDTRRFEQYTIEELTEQFPLALIEITSEAVPAAVEAA